MGVLEDAIREHLELKRRHGASDEELSRQEAEALGPARREAPDAEPELAEPEPGMPEPEAPVDQDTVMYAPGEAPVPPEEERDLDFEDEAPDQRPPPRGFDFE